MTKQATEATAQMNEPATNTKMPTTFPPHWNDIKDATSNNNVKIVSWNVASLKASLKKGCDNYVQAEHPDILCLQETKIKSKQEGDAVIPSGWKKMFPYRYWHAGETSGYAGCALLSRTEPMHVEYGFHAHSDKEEQEKVTLKKDTEGRVVTAEFPDFVVVNVYVPNAGQKLDRLDWKIKVWMPAFQHHLRYWATQKPLMVVGDVNVCMQDVDLARPKENRNKTAGFTVAEQQAWSEVMDALKLSDVWREWNPELQRYTYFSYRFQCRSKNLGWRLDQMLVDERLKDRVVQSEIREEAYGASDHVPLVLLLGDTE